ncbi:MAG: flagellar basal body protein [Tepidisphaeraceae bacterium]|jgi:flagellar hook-associated protein FlgK
MDVLAIAASGMQAAQAQMTVAANNIAHQNTPGYKAQRVNLVDVANYGGVEVAGVQSTGQSVDPATEMAKLRQAQFMYGANAMVVRAADQMYGSLLNVLDTDNGDSHQYNL